MLSGQSSEYPRPQWLFDPLIDSLAVSNLYWPILVCAIFLAARVSGFNPFLLTMFLIIVPHRVMTLPLLASDRTRMAAHWRFYLFAGVVTAVLFFICYQLPKGRGVLLIALGLWNTWHVAAQHYGVSRIYGILSSSFSPPKRSVKYFLIATLVYSQLRGLSFFSADFVNLGIDIGWLQEIPLEKFDLLFLLAIIGFAGYQLSQMKNSVAKKLYLSQVGLLCGFRILACHFGWPTLVGALIYAGECFHATEYLAVSSWTFQRREKKGQMLGFVVKNLGLCLLTYCLVIAICAQSIRLYNPALWTSLAFLLGFWHFLYDGMIWKMKKVFPSY